MPAGAAERIAVVPDGCADLVWSGSRWIVAGPDREAGLERVPPGRTVIGVRFQPGALTRWLGVPASEILGERIPLDCFRSGKARQFIDSIGDARRIETTLAEIAGNYERPDDFCRTVTACVGEIRKSHGMTARALASALGMSERTLRRRCNSEFGYGPGTLDRVLRMQRFLKLARKRGGSGLANLAVEAGYADQAHLTREARRLSGLTPGAILAQLSDPVGRFVQDGRACRVVFKNYDSCIPTSLPDRQIQGTPEGPR